MDEHLPPLDPVYPVVFIDAVHVQIRYGHVANRPICLRRHAATIEESSASSTIPPSSLAIMGWHRIESTAE